MGILRKSHLSLLGKILVALHLLAYRHASRNYPQFKPQTPRSTLILRTVELTTHRTRIARRVFTSNPKSQTYKMLQKESVKPLKNLLVLLLSSPLYTLAPTSLKDLQTSVLFVNGLGSKTQTVKHVTKSVVQLVFATFVSKKFGVKYVLVIATIARCIFPFALLYPAWYVLYPSALIDGMAAAPMSSTRYSYTMELVESFSKASGKKLFLVSSLFFGALNFTNSLGHMIGCLFSYFVLSRNVQTQSETHSDDLSLCGSSFCDDTGIANISRFRELPETTSYALYGGFASCTFLSGLLILFFLDPHVETKPEEKKTNSSVAKISLKDTLQVFADKFYLLLSPTSIFKGMMAGFVSGEFSKAYVSCTFGVDQVGMVLVLFTITDCVGSFVSSFVNSRLCRIFSLIFAYVSTACILILLLMWKPHPDQKYILFLSSAIMGFSNAVVRCQLTSFYGLLFNDVKEAGFNMFAILEDLGEIVAWAYSSYLCVEIKLYILAPFLLLGLLGYVVAEFVHIISERRFAVTNLAMAA